MKLFENVSPQEDSEVYASMSDQKISQRINKAMQLLDADTMNINTIELVDASQFLNFLVMFNIDVTSRCFNKESENWKNFINHYNTEGLSEEAFIRETDNLKQAMREQIRPSH